VRANCTGLKTKRGWKERETIIARAQRGGRRNLVKLIKHNRFSVCSVVNFDNTGARKRRVP
jgi:hypothetical protein